MTGEADATGLLAAGLNELSHETAETNDHALALFELVIATDERYAAAYEALARAYLQRTEDLGLGSQWLEPAAAAAIHALDLDGSLADACYVLARTYRIRGWLREELEVWRRRLGVAPHDATASERLGWVLWFSGRAEEALPPLEAAASVRPKNSWVYFYMGNAKLALGQFALAELMYRNALDIDPRHSSAQAGVIWSLLAARKDGEARAELHNFQTGSFDDDRYSLKLADIEYFLDDRSSAISHAEQSLEDAQERYWPRGLLASTLLGAALWNLDRSAAEEYFERSEQIDHARLEGGDQGFMAHIDRAAIKSIIGDVDAACDSLRAAIAAGWRYSALAVRDRLFENIRTEPDFVALLESV